MVRKIKLEVTNGFGKISSFFLYLSLSLFFFFCFLPTPDLYIYNYVKALFPPFWLFYFSGRGLIIEPKIMKEAKIYSLYLDPFLKMGY